MSSSILKLSNLSRVYKDRNKNLKIIDDLDLEVEKGDFVAVLGKSGSGKSTFLHLVGMLDEADGGTVIIDNKDVSVLSEDERDSLRNKFLGFVFQFHYLLPEFTALENVMLPGLVDKNIDRKAVEKRALELLEAVELGERAEHKPKELSGGEKQRVAIARALINSPKILLADEPTGNLDQETSEVIHRILKDINEKYKQTIVVVTHSQELASVCKRRLYLKKGKLENMR
jgi:lipoprotein-releasing system ATP-binding protein